MAQSILTARRFAVSPGTDTITYVTKGAAPQNVPLAAGAHTIHEALNSAAGTVAPRRRAEPAPTISDDFSDTDGTLLTGRAADLGGTWAWAGAHAIKSGTDRPSASGTHQIGIANAAANCRVAANITRFATAASAPALISQHADSGDTVRVSSDWLGDPGAWRICEGSTILANLTEDRAAGVGKRLHFQANGTASTLRVDGTATLTAAGRTGPRMAGATAFAADNFAAGGL